MYALVAVTTTRPLLRSLQLAAARSRVPQYLGSRSAPAYPWTRRGRRTRLRVAAMVGQVGQVGLLLGARRCSFLPMGRCLSTRARAPLHRPVLPSCRPSGASGPGGAAQPVPLRVLNFLTRYREAPLAGVFMACSRYFAQQFHGLRSKCSWCSHFENSSVNTDS